MKKLIKYRRLCAILLLIVLISSNAHVCAKIIDEPSSVPGSGTSADPYIISISGGRGGKVVLKPEEVPFYFKVTGTGGVGGVFAIDYDISSGLVSFSMTKNVSSSDIKETCIVVTQDTYNAETYQSGVRAESKDEVDTPKYDITEEHTSPVKSTKLANVKMDVSEGASYEKTDSYFLAENPDSDEDFEALEYSSKNDSIMYKFNGLNNTALDEQENKVSSVEEIISRVFMAFGDILLYMIQLIFGKKLTIDALIFNKYDDTKLSFYSKSSSDISKAVASVVNTWYGIFSKLAYLLYVVVLVYIGVMILVTAGTGDQDKRKKSLGDWFAGLAIMFAVPTFVIPSLIKLNDAFVEFMYNKKTERINTYYNYYDSEGDILGGDSATLSIEELRKTRKDTSKELENFEQEKTQVIDKVIDGINNELSYDITEDEKKVLSDRFTNLYELVKGFVFNTNQWAADDTEKFNAALSESRETLRRKANIGAITGELYGVALNYFYADTDDMQDLLNAYREIYSREEKIKAIDQLVEIKQTDLMTIMRDYAGKYTRMVFVVVWFLLIFQMVAMIFIYYKRIFVIAVLITIFPLVMIFYCIDKMADGSAQTLSMWFKELISDIFIQSIHCVMYVVLVQMGLEIYRNDSNNWFLFLAAMLMLVPAERMMKEIFGLNSGSLGQLGGMGMNIAMGIGAAVKLGKMGAKGAGNFLMR